MIPVFGNRTCSNMARTHVDIAGFCNAHEEHFTLSNNYLHLRFLPKFHAYIDPGTGSFILQLLLGFLFGGLLAIKLFWTSIKRFFGKLLFRKRDTGKDEG
jgi:hypothetical protein